MPLGIIIGHEGLDAMSRSPRTLRVLIVDGQSERQREVTATVRSLGHEVVGEGADIANVAEVTMAELPDLALVTRR